jgi:peptidoglycan/xylan/chitin deacetylase (PgdA/CDA1 family)
MLRSLAKDAAAHVATWTGLDAAARSSAYIVGYHRVVERIDAHKDFALPAMEVSIEVLEKQLDWLGRNFEIIPVDDAAATTSRKRSKPLAAVTFDDGYADVFYNAFPLLKRKGIPATIFVVTDLIGTKQVPLHDRLYAVLSHTRCPNPFAATQRLLRTHDYDGVVEVIHQLDADGRICGNAPAALHPLTWQMLAEMRDAGITIGSHSKTHAFLTKESARRVREEVRESRAALRENLGIEADLFAYPGGDFNAPVVDAVYEAGYRLAFSICRHSDARRPMLTIGRRGLWQQSCLDRFGRFSPAIMSCHAAALFGRAANCPNQH